MNACIKTRVVRRAVIKGPSGSFFRSVRLTKGVPLKYARRLLGARGLNCPRIIVLSGSRVCENTGMRCVEVWR